MGVAVRVWVRRRGRGRMDRVTTEHTRVHVKGAGVRVEGGTCSAEGVVMGTLLTEKVNAIIDVSRSKGFGAQRATGPCVGLGGLGRLNGGRSRGLRGVG